MGLRCYLLNRLDADKIIFKLLFNKKHEDIKEKECAFVHLDCI